MRISKRQRKASGSTGSSTRKTVSGLTIPGARIRFTTDARQIAARLDYTALSPRLDTINSAGWWMVDGKMDGTFTCGAQRPGKTVASPRIKADGAVHEYELILPYGDSIDFNGLEVNAEAKFFPVKPRPRTRYVAYGDSITHGYHATDVSHTYPFLVAADKGWQLINMGFGSREMTASDGAVVGSLQADVITVLMGFNDYYHNKSVKNYTADAIGLLRGIRSTQPRVPVYYMTPLWSTEPLPTKLGLHLEDYRKALRAALASVHDANLHIVEGPDLIPHDPKYFADGIHPNDAGFAILAKSLEKVLP